jgi:acetaldehyde dehydrogenase (acetylating)
VERKCWDVVLFQYDPAKAGSLGIYCLSNSNQRSNLNKRNANKVIGVQATKMIEESISRLHILE